MEIMTIHRGINVRRDRAQILTYYRGSVSMRLQAHNSVELFCSIADINTLGCSHPLRYPEETMQAHNVINTQQAGIPQMVPYAGNVVTIALLSQSFWV